MIADRLRAKLKRSDYSPQVGQRSQNVRDSSSHENYPMLRKVRPMMTRRI
jgi:hypothetical protein